MNVQYFQVKSYFKHMLKASYDSVSDHVSYRDIILSGDFSSNKVISMQMMSAHCFLPQGEAGARGLPGIPGNVSKVAAFQTVRIKSNIALPCAT